MKNTYVTHHNFNYGTGQNNKDSVIHKLTLRNKKDLIYYIKELLKANINYIEVQNYIATNNTKLKTKIDIKII